MQSGILIGYVGRETKFWYPCSEKQIKSELAKHVAHWGREMVAGKVVEVPIESLIVTFCDGFDTEEEPVNPRTIDAVKLLK
jgi:hypothetical protein